MFSNRFLPVSLFVIFASLAHGQSGRPQRSPRSFVQPSGIVTVQEQHRALSSAQRAVPSAASMVITHGESESLMSGFVILQPPDPSMIQSIRDRNVVSSRQAVQIGFSREAEIGLGDGVWNDVFQMDGVKRVWLVKLQSPDAVAIRIHFRKLTLPSGVMLRLYTPDHPDYAVELGSEGPQSRGEFWSPAIFGPVVQFEIVDNREEALIAEPPVIEIDSIGHWFDGLFGTSAACELDFSCYPAWATTGNSVGRLIFNDQGSDYACSGALLANGSGDFAPYFLTAQHCINNSSAVSTSQVFWLDQSSQCSGGAPPLYQLKYTHGEKLLSMSDSSDQTLMLLSSDVPPEIPFAGWTTASPQYGIPVTAIHHPRADPKKISSGTTGIEQSFDGIRYIPVTFTAGVTEPGSSGSPLFTADHLLIGTDSLGSFQSCVNRGGPAYFGSFRQGFEDLNDTGNHNYLTDGYYGSDVFSPNQTMASAALIPIPTPPTTTLNVSVWREDWFKLVVPSHTGIEIMTRDLSGATNTISAWVLTATSSVVGSFTLPIDTSGIASPFVQWNQSDSDAVYYIKIFTSNETPLNYRLGVARRSYGPPIVTTGTAVFYSPSGMNLYGTVDASGLSTTHHFEYSFSGDLSNPVLSEEVPSYFGVQIWIQSYPLNQVMSYRLVAKNSAGTSYGETKHVRTPAYSVPVAVNQTNVYFSDTLPGQTTTAFFPLYVTSALQVNSITISGSPVFSIQTTTPCNIGTSVNNCGTITFSPSAPGTYSGSISIALADGRQYTFGLLGNSASSLPPTNLNLSEIEPLGYTFKAPINGFDYRTVTLFNPTPFPVTVYEFDITPNYLQTNNCPATLAAGASCAIKIAFHPTADYQSDSSSGSLTVLSRTQGLRNVVYMHAQILNSAVTLERPRR